MDGSPQYAVLIEFDEDPRRAAVSEGVAKARGIPFQDAAMAVKNAWGLLAEAIPLEDADRLIAFLAAQQVKAKRLPAEELLALPLPPVVKNMTISESALRLEWKDESVELPWTSIALISVAAYKEVTTKTRKVVETENAGAGQKMLQAGVLLATGLPLLGNPLSNKKKEVEKTSVQSELLFFVDLLVFDPLRRYRLDAQHLDYSCLGSRKEYGSLPNFRIVLKEFFTRAPHAGKNRGACVMAANQPVVQMGYESLADLDREQRRLASLLPKRA